MTDVIAPETEIDVVFANTINQALQAGLSNPAVVITPDPNNWNDYGWRVFANVVIVAGGIMAEAGPIRLMFAGELSTAVAMARFFAVAGPVIPVEQAPSDFVSLLPSPGRYTNFVRILGFDRAILALHKLRDAALARAVGPTDAQAVMMDSDAFWEGMLRADGAYGSLRRGLRTVRREAANPIPDAAVSFTVQARLPSARTPHQLDFNFEPDTFGRNRMAVLIGRNGVGKTQLLRRLVDVHQEGHDANEVAINPRPAFRRVIVFSSVTSDPYPRTIPPWAGVDYEYFSMTAPTEAGTDALLQALVSIRRDHGDRLGEGQIFRLDVFQQIMRSYGLLDRLHLPLRPVRGDRRFGHEFTWGDKRYFPFDGRLAEQQELLLAGEIDWSRPVTIFSANSVRQLSSGETALLRFAAQAVASIDQSSLLLFDEPETHLHPNFVSDFMGILHDLLDRTRSIAIIATHSAYVVREVPRERVNVMTVDDDGQPNADAPRLQTFGASIDSISQFVFNDGGVPHWHLKRLRQWVEGPGRELTIEQIVEHHGAELNPETLSWIAELKREGDVVA